MDRASIRGAPEYDYSETGRCIETWWKDTDVGTGIKEGWIS
jgi:hypothetical protein